MGSSWDGWQVGNCQLEGGNGPPRTVLPPRPATAEDPDPRGGRPGRPPPPPPPAPHPARRRVESRTTATAAPRSRGQPGNPELLCTHIVIVFPWCLLPGTRSAQPSARWDTAAPQDVSRAPGPGCKLHAVRTSFKVPAPKWEAQARPAAPAPGRPLGHHHPPCPHPSRRPSCESLVQTGAVRCRSLPSQGMYVLN